MKTIAKVCLRCDWEGDTRAPTCPSCGAALWVPRREEEPRGRRWRGPSWRRQRRPPGPRAEPEPAVVAPAPEVAPLPSHPEVVRLAEPEAIAATRSPRERRRALLTGLLVGLVALVAVLVIREGTPATTDPVAAGIGGRLVYAVRDDADPAFFREFWIYDLDAGEFRRGPQLPEPIRVIRASDVGGDAVVTISRNGDRFSADLLRFLAPSDRAVPVLEADRVAWAPRGEVAFGASVLPGCEKVQLQTWNPTTALGTDQERPCADLVDVAMTDEAGYVATTGGGPPVVDRVTDTWVGEYIRGYVPVGASGSDLLVIPADGPSDAEIGPALYASTGSPDRPELVPVGAPNELFAFEAMLSAGTGGLGDLVLGTYEGVRGIYRIEGSAEQHAVRPGLILETAASVVGATPTDAGDVIASLDGRLVAISAKTANALALPDDAPEAGAMLVWLPAVPETP